MWRRRYLETYLRVGRSWGLPAEHLLAFATGTHGRLGAASPVRSLAGKVELLRLIAGWCRGWVSRSAGKEEGVVRLLAIRALCPAILISPSVQVAV